jgi:prepilin-type processing-associated H-X9-DG protein
MDRDDLKSTRIAARADGSSARCRGWHAFSLVELLIVIGIITSLVGIVVPTVAKARESAYRVQCASNLRQVGLAERMYAHENNGWLYLRVVPHAGTVDELTRGTDGYWSVPLAKYAVPSVFFCPTAQMTWEPSGMSEGGKRSMVASYHIGYAVYGAFWNNGTQAPEASSPWWGAPPPITGGDYKITHLKPWKMRMGEWMQTSAIVAGPNNKPLAFHHRRKYAKLQPGLPRPDGGNILMGDGSVQWTSGLFRYYGGEIYSVPDQYSNWP